jgi:hypothetical protein
MHFLKTSSMRLVVASLVVALLVTAGRGAAEAGGTWQWRGIVRPRGEVGVDFGLGIGRAPAAFVGAPGPGTVTGFGMNLEIAAGVGSNIELGFRTGVRMGWDGRVTQADRYGRAFETETYGTAFDSWANPELRLRGALISGGAAELALEGRAYLPLENGSDFGFMLGVPLILRLAILRIDTGVFVPVVLHDETLTIISIPAAVWFQVSSTAWLGPMFGLRAVRHGDTAYPFGFGVGTMLTHTVDLRGWIWFPDIGDSQSSRVFGGGVALEVVF